MIGGVFLHLRVGEVGGGGEVDQSPLPMPQVQGALTGASTNHCHKGPDQFTVIKILNNKKFIVFSIQHIFHNNLHI